MRQILDVLTGRRLWDVVQGDCRELLRAVPARSVHLCLTSPPYWGLRAYGTDPKVWGGETLCPHDWEGAFCNNCGAWRGELGQEPDPDLFVAHLVEIFREVRRTLRDDGLLWVNLGDSYASAGPANKVQARGIPDKSLVGIPFRFALAMIADGWVLRSDVIWHKCLEGTMPIYARVDGKPIRTSIRELFRLNHSDMYLPGQDGKWLRVERFEALGKREVLTLHLRNGSRYQVTPEHRIPTQRGLLQASQIVCGDRIETGTLPDEEGTPIGTNDVGWLAGFFLAEGNYEGPNSVRFSIHANETAYAQRLLLIARQFGAEGRVHTYGNRAAVILTGPVIRALVENYIQGKGSKRKHLGRRVWAESNNFLNSLLQGYLQGDGHYDQQNKRWRIGFAWNPELVCDLRTLCTRLGYFARIRGARAKCEGKSYAAARGEIRTTRSGHHNQRHDYEVCKIELTEGTVYDLEIEEPHLFTLPDGSATHNSNALPESIDNRPSKAHEYFLMFSKSNRPVFWTHPDRPGVRKKPKPDYVWVNRESKERVTEAPEGWRELTRKNPYTGKREKLWRRINLWRARDYYFDMDAIREPYSEETTWEEYEVKHQKDPEGTLAQESGSVKARIREKGPNPLGRAKRSVWSLPTESLGLDHFAAFPGTLIEPIILSGTSEWGVCPACGAPYTRVVKREPTAANQKAVPQHRAGGDRLGHFEGPAVTVGWHPTCDCNAGRPVGAVVLDPFSGSGTSGREARRRDRRYLGFELNPRYVTMSKDRIMNDAPLLNFEWEGLADEEDPEEEEEEAE